MTAKLPVTMKAVMQNQFGGPDVLQIKALPRPEPGPQELLVAVHAASVGYGDLLARRFDSLTQAEFNMPGLFLPLARLEFGRRTPKKTILGAEFSGEVVAMGNNVEGFSVGDAVFGYLGSTFGANAQYLCINSKKWVAHKPDNISFEQAAAIPYGALTAMSLMQKLPLQAGQHLLVNGASGSIGSAVVQLAKYQGAEVTDACSERHKECLNRLGADHWLDYRQAKENWPHKAYDAIFDVLGKCSFEQANTSLKPGGTLFCTSFKGRHLWRSLAGNKSQAWRVKCALASYSQANLTEVARLINEGVLTPEVSKSFPLEAIAEAHRYKEGGLGSGAVVVLPGQ